MMMAFHNSKERTLDDFAALLQNADTRLRLSGCIQPKGSLHAFIEATFDLGRRL
jgi:hypothetical protein